MCFFGFFTNKDKNAIKIWKEEEKKKLKQKEKEKNLKEKKEKEKLKYKEIKKYFEKKGK